MSRLLEEIREQPAVLRRLLGERFAQIQEIAGRLRERDIHYVLMAARGSSGNAATYGKYLFGIWNHLPVALAAPSLFTLYQRPPLLEGALVIGLSQSGASEDVVAVIREARRQGVPTLAITNSPSSPLASHAEESLDLSAGPELSVAATKTYTAELMALALLSVALAEDGQRLAEARLLPDVLEAVLSTEPALRSSVERYRYMPECAVIGRGYNYATALEIALKMKELTYLGTYPYSSADFRHGPVAIVEPSFPVLIIAPSGLSFPDLADLLSLLEERGAELLGISDDEALLSRVRTPLRIPAGLPEWLSPLVAVIPGQLFAYYLALAKGLDPHTPRGLSKVTITR